MDLSSIPEKSPIVTTLLLHCYMKEPKSALCQPFDEESLKMCKSKGGSHRHHQEEVKKGCLKEN